VSWRLEEDPANGDRVLTTNTDAKEYGRWRFNYGFEELLMESLGIVKRQTGWRQVAAYDDPDAGVWQIRPIFDTKG
jgi:hypothetical protein